MIWGIMDTQQRFDELKTKFRSALSYIENHHIPLQMMNVQDNRLVVRAVVRSGDIRERIVEEFRKADPSLGDVYPDIRIEGEDNVSNTGQSGVQTSEDFAKQGEPLPGSSIRR